MSLCLCFNYLRLRIAVLGVKRGLDDLQIDLVILNLDYHLVV